RKAFAARAVNDLALDRQTGFQHYGKPRGDAPRRAGSAHSRRRRVQGRRPRIACSDDRSSSMIEGWSVVALALGYVSILFALAWYADRAGRFTKTGDGRPLIYALSLAVYCTSWTFFGSVGLAASTGYNFIPVYLGPILLFAF